ncbi:MAG: ABC transporter ATP-binding protein [Patescibacteria group bacterium]
MIELKNIIKEYTIGGNKQRVLIDVNLSVADGEFIAIMGPSGSGKSTLMNIIGMLDNPTSGSYLLNNKNVANLNDDALADIRLNNIGFIFQSYNLLKRSTVLRNVMLPFIYSGVPKNNKEREAKAIAALKRVGFNEPELWHHYSNQLSGGQMQRVAIARALVNEPEILLADEPTGNLDSKTGALVIDTFKKLHREKKCTIIMITHSQEIAAQANRTIKIKDGEICS